MNAFNAVGVILDSVQTSSLENLIQIVEMTEKGKEDRGAGLWLKRTSVCTINSISAVINSLFFGMTQWPMPTHQKHLTLSSTSRKYGRA